MTSTERYPVETVHVDDEGVGYFCTEGGGGQCDEAIYIINADHWSRGRNTMDDDLGRVACEKHRPTSVKVTPGSPWPS